MTEKNNSKDVSQYDTVILSSENLPDFSKNMKSCSECLRKNWCVALPMHDDNGVIIACM